jgi:MEMO1 family protein
MHRFFVIFCASFMVVSLNCNSQNAMKNTLDRPPAVAGQFYPADSTKLLIELADLFLKARPNQSANVLAVIAPHAGYVFSGEVAASSFNQIDASKDYKHIFVIGSSHRVYFKGAAIYTDGNFITPLGIVEVDTALGENLIRENNIFMNYNEAHRAEHCLEVELPFLQYKLKNHFNIVPIVIGTDDAADCKKIAEALKPYFNQDNLFVISSDFSHYPKYSDAEKVDKLTAEAILSNSPKNLLNVLQSNEKLSIPNLATSLCGWSSVVTLLYMTEKNEKLKLSSVEYKNSGDSPLYGDSSRVVGYTAMTVSMKQEDASEFSLNKNEETNLLFIARNTLENYIKYGKFPPIDTSLLSNQLKKNCGAFVTLKKDGELRGCIGRFTANSPLYQIVQEMTKSAATEDYRFSKVTESELDHIDIEISVLSPLHKIQSIDEIEMGKHGIYISKGNNSGTYLPQVATQTGWSKKEFLGHCAEDKAGIGWNGWKDADIYVYTAIVFGEKKDK